MYELCIFKDFFMWAGLKASPVYKLYKFLEAVSSQLAVVVYIIKFIALLTQYS